MHERRMRRRLLLQAGVALAILAGGVSIAAHRASDAGLSPAVIYARCAPGVVDIRVTGSVQGPLGSEGFQAEGSGFVLDRRGDVVTAEHVVAGATSIVVRFQSGLRARATVVSRSVDRDLALMRVRVPGAALHPLPLGTAHGVRPGDAVVAIGSILGYPRSVTAGVVSAVGRTIVARNGATIHGALQADVAIGAGSSGGPLLDTRGRVIGVNVQVGGSDYGFEGVGFAVAVDDLRALGR